MPLGLNLAAAAQPHLQHVTACQAVEMADLELHRAQPLAISKFPFEGIAQRAQHWARGVKSHRGPDAGQLVAGGAGHSARRGFHGQQPLHGQQARHHRKIANHPVPNAQIDAAKSVLTARAPHIGLADNIQHGDLITGGGGPQVGDVDEAVGSTLQPPYLRPTPVVNNNRRGCHRRRRQG